MQGETAAPPNAGLQFVAALPMYDLPGLGEAHAMWWRGLARHLRAEGICEVPGRLATAGAGDPYRLWRDPGLLLSQTCGYPLVHFLNEQLRVVATPRYDAPGCHGADYCSLVLVRSDDPAERVDDLADSVAVINAWDSQSGMSALRATVAPAAAARGGRFFRAVEVSGNHLASAAAVAEGRARVCAVDCVTHALAARHLPEALAGTRILCRSPAAPALPYVTAAGNAELLPRLRAALGAATTDPALAEVRAELLIGGFEVLADDAYDRILEIERAAAAEGYPKLQ
ncbi:MAG: PhnD/SsuA/transferrin family substrate-binding protein [Rhodovibrionaceae bacterium]|nr:PhnD/SsuA/transferrin family substrate-binding protein [Rhodovibrionaceae bacterium]